MDRIETEQSVRTIKGEVFELLYKGVKNTDISVYFSTEIQYYINDNKETKENECIFQDIDWISETGVKMYDSRERATTIKWKDKEEFKEKRYEKGGYEYWT